MSRNYIHRLTNKIAWAWLLKTTYSRSAKVMQRRTALYHRFLKEMGQSCKIKGGCIIEYPENISMGSGVTLQHHCFLNGYGGITIGNDVSLGMCVEIFTAKHPYHNVAQPFKYNKLETGHVTIGNNVGIGAGSIILCGVHIGDNVYIGAGSVVTKDVPSNTVWAGNPARYIKDF